MSQLSFDYEMFCISSFLLGRTYPISFQGNIPDQHFPNRLSSICSEVFNKKPYNGNESIIILSFDRRIKLYVIVAIICLSGLDVFAYQPSWGILRMKISLLNYVLVSR